MKDYNVKRDDLAKTIKQLYADPRLSIRIDYTSDRFGCVKTTSEGRWIEEERTYHIPRWVIEGCSEDEIIRAVREIGQDGNLSPQNRLRGEYDLYSVIKELKAKTGFLCPVTIIEGWTAKCYFSGGTIIISRELIGRFSRGQIALAILSSTNFTEQKTSHRPTKRRERVSVIIGGSPCLIEKELLWKMSAGIQNKNVTAALKKIGIKPDDCLPGTFNP